MKDYITPNEFKERVSGLSYDKILLMCKTGEIETVKTPGGHFKIPLREVERFRRVNDDFISREEYEAVIRENERLKLRLEQIKILTA